MAKVAANGIQIEYETFGDPASPALLLIIGFGCQLLYWDEQLCRQLAERGHHVIRFDNRDTGLSSKIEEAGLPDIVQAIEAQIKGEAVKPPYTIEDMADDAVGLLNALGIEKAHICGMSMGGFIAQAIAINHPAKTLSLTSIYSKTGDPTEPQVKPEVRELLMAPPPLEREPYIEHMLNLWRAITGPGFPLDDAWGRQLAADTYDRAFYPPGAARQFMAILTQKNRKTELGSVTIPALVIHGSEDPVVPVGCGQNTAQAIPGAKLLIIEGMGHDLPHGGAWPQIVDAIVDHTHRVGF